MAGSIEATLELWAASLRDVNPVRLIAGPGQEHDIKRAADLVEDIRADAVIADKGCDANALREKIKTQGGKVVIPPRKNRKVPHRYDEHPYKERNKVERFFSKLKQFRRVATRYDKLLENFMGFVKIAAMFSEATASATGFAALCGETKRSPGVIVLRPAIDVPATEYDRHLDAMIAALPAGSAKAARLQFAKRKGWVVDRGGEQIFTRGRA